jgi:hypothetical protein
MKPEWYATHTGKCGECGEMKSLDSMIAANQERSKYKCKDCIIPEFLVSYTEVPKLVGSVESSRFQKLMGWCFG